MATLIKTVKILKLAALSYRPNMRMVDLGLSCITAKPIFPSGLIRMNKSYSNVRKVCSFSHYSYKVGRKKSGLSQSHHINETRVDTLFYSGKHLHFRTFSQSSDQGQPRQFDPNRESRRQKLMFFTYVSCFVGTLLLGAVGYRQYGRMARKAQGMEELYIREYGRRPALIRYRGFLMPAVCLSGARNIHNFQVREDDVWVVSYPKSGTTWVQEIVYLLNSDLDFESAARENLEERFPYLEYPHPGVKAIDAMPSPRYIKSHLPISLLPNQMKEKKPKIIYVARNPKDIVVSLYHFHVKFLKPAAPFYGNFEDYCRLFTEDLTIYSPWSKHVLEGWKCREDDNVLVLFYEDLKSDIGGAVRQIASFLNKNVTDSQVEAVVAHCSFDAMSKNPSVNFDWMKGQGLACSDEKFYRKGEVGDWKNHLSEDVVKKLDEIVASRVTPHGVPIRDMPVQQN